MQPIKTIAIVSALKEELDYLYDKNELDWGPLCGLNDELQFRECVVNNYRIVSTHASGMMGLTETAIMTTRVILGYMPEFIAMIGVCGGFKERGVNIGDVIIADKSFHSQFGSFKNGCIQKELKVCEVDHGSFSRLTDFLDQTKISKIQISSPRGMKKSDKVLKAWIGPMASADLVVKDKNKLVEAQEAERKVIAVDMESYAFLRASHLLGVNAVVVKSVSDFADVDKGEDDDLREYAKFNSTEALFEFIKYAFFLKSSNKENDIIDNVLTKSQKNTEIDECSPNKIHEIQSFMKSIMAGMSTIPPGSFSIGDAKIGIQEIQIRHSFMMSKTPVTQSLYQKIMDNNPSHFKGDHKPVERVSWYEAIAFCNKLSQFYNYEEVYKIDNETISLNINKKGFRLPTEAEWEYSCNGTDINDLEDKVWFHNNSDKQTHEIGQLGKNKNGLFDMLGNVWEWCYDSYEPNHEDRYKINPVISNNSVFRVIRGGSWVNFKSTFESGFRDKTAPAKRKNNIGFRIVLQNYKIN